MEKKTKNDDQMATIQEKYAEARKLLDPGDKQDQPDSKIELERKNEAVKILKEMEEILEDRLKNDEKPDEQLTFMSAIVSLNIGIVFVDNEELKSAEENFVHCMDTLAGKELNAKGILAALSALNQLGIISFQWSETDKAEDYWKQAERMHEEYASLEIGDPVSMSGLFGITDKEEPTPSQVLDKLFTMTLYYLAQVYGLNAEAEKSAKYCHSTLKRQLNHENLDSIDWALNAATLAQVLMEQKGFTQARHHLAAALYIMNKYEKELKETPEKEENDEALAAKWEEFRHRRADVARCWAKYGIVLMTVSRERLVELSENSDSNGTVDSNFTKKEYAENLEGMIFADLEKELEPIAQQVTDKYVLDFNDARKVFLNVQSWLEEAQKYYTFASHASDHIKIVQDSSQVYNCVAFFEDNDEHQAKMHKRRIDLLEPIVEELNPQYYQAECRQIWIELAETYSAILNIKLDRLRTIDDKLNAEFNHVVKKINKLATSSIKYYQKFLDSFKASPDSPRVTKFTDEMARAALYSYFHLGTLYNKIITADKHAQLDNLKNSIDSYKFFIDYCDSNEALAESMKQELSVCRDLISLLPIKMNRLLQLISTQ